MIDRIITELKNFAGIKRKRGINAILSKLRGASLLGGAVYSLGDDAGVVRHGDEFLLLAVEEINRSLLEADPWWAGFCAVLTNVNDIYAMGGIPLALVNTVSFRNPEQGEKVLQGMSEACEKYEVPMVGGHFTPESEPASLSAAILGSARKLLTSFDARDGDSLIVAAELKGKQYKDFLNWDCISDKTSKQILEKLGVMPYIAEHSLARAAKDISNAGIVGTICMLLETSRKGAVIVVEDIPAPENIDLVAWLKMYPSYGFVLSAPQEKKEELIAALSEKGYSTASVGLVNESGKVMLRYHGEDQEFLDFNIESIFA